MTEMSSLHRFTRRAVLYAPFALVLLGCSRPGSDTPPASSVVSVPSANSALAPGAGASAALPAASAAPAASATGNRVYGQATQQIAVKVGERFAVLLPASIGTPMKWRIDPMPDAAVLSVLGESYSDTPPSDCADCTGYAGTRRFDFEAKATGKVALDFGYRPLTQPKAAAEKQVHIEVSVSP